MYLFQSSLGRSVLDILNSYLHRTELEAE